MVVVVMVVVVVADNITQHNCHLAVGGLLI